MSTIAEYFARLFGIRDNNTRLILETLQYPTFLGEGEFGVVLKAIDPRDIQNQSPPTAVKFIFPTSSADWRFTARECEITRNLQRHDNIVQILAVVATRLDLSELVPIFRDCNSQRPPAWPPKVLKKYLDNSDSDTVNTICIQQELCGENLRKWLNHHLGHNREDPGIQLVQVAIVQNLITGLKYLHDSNIIHRDLNPNNIMFTRENFALPVKIGDFGLCRTIQPEDTQNLTANVGTKRYRAPEVSSGNYSRQADLYSLGLIIWEVVQLIRYEDRGALLHQLVALGNGRVVEDHPLIPRVRELINNLIMERVEDRIQSIDHVANYL